MNKYFKYLGYIFRHKWYVFIECCKEGMPLRGLIHDWSKFRPSEFFPYVNYFYNAPPTNKTGYYKPTNTHDAAFEDAWFLHIQRNPHHWQYWCTPTSGAKCKPREMPRKLALEMVCDWTGAGKAQGATSLRAWYKRNKKKILLHSATRKFVEAKIKERE